RDTIAAVSQVSCFPFGKEIRRPKTDPDAAVNDRIRGRFSEKPMSLALDLKKGKGGDGKKDCQRHQRRTES
ncbi:MAG: hypothetical protein ACLP05_09195, partial [Candidatus Kryptoniota bacterium]